MKLFTAFALMAAWVSAPALAGNIIRTPAPISYKVPAETTAPSEKPLLALNAKVLQDAVINTPYAFDFSTLASWSGLGSGAIAPTLSWSTTNALPNGLSLSAQGQLTGTPSTVETTSFEIVATHVDGEGRQLYTLKVGELVFQATSLAAGSYHTCAVLADTTVKCWGRNDDGQLGDNSTTLRRTPVSVSGLTGVQALAAGSNHTCATLNTGEVKCWGYNGYGQLGNNSTTNRHTPVSVSP